MFLLDDLIHTLEVGNYLQMKPPTPASQASKNLNLSTFTFPSSRIAVCLYTKLADPDGEEKLSLLLCSIVLLTQGFVD